VYSFFVNILHWLFVYYFHQIAVTLGVTVIREILTKLGSCPQWPHKTEAKFERKYIRYLK